MLVGRFSFRQLFGFDENVIFMKKRFAATLLKKGPTCNVREVASNDLLCKQKDAAGELEIIYPVKITFHRVVVDILSKLFPPE